MTLYDDHLHSTYWRQIREQALARDNGCRLCGSLENLQAHHRTYARLGQESLDDLTTLCSECHDVVTDHQRRKRYTTRELPSVQDVASPVALSRTYVSSYQEIALEENREVPHQQRLSTLDAQWQALRSTGRVGESHEENHGKDQKDRRRS